MSSSACAKKVLCCSQQKAQSAAVGDTLDGWFAVEEIAAQLEGTHNRAILESAFDAIDASTKQMKKAQKILNEIEIQ